MRTSVDLPDHLFVLAKQKAAAEGTTLREVVIESLRGYLIPNTAVLPPPKPGEPFRFPVDEHATGGMLPGIDPTKTSAMLEIE